MTGVSVAEIAEFLERAADTDACQFWACPGPDVEPVDGATCYACRQAHDARALLRRVQRHGITQT